MNINLKKLSKNIFYVIKFIIMLFSFKITLIILFFFFNDLLSHKYDEISKIYPKS